jgi:hypothetical protein
MAATTRTTLLGSQGADVFLGGAGNDFIFGDNGNDVALMGAGDDVFQWDPGDGNDTVEGQDGADSMIFFGSNASESINISRQRRARSFLRDVANVTMDLDDVESIEFRALGGADNMIAGDMTGTDTNGAPLRPARPEWRRRRRGGHGRPSTVPTATMWSEPGATRPQSTSSACQQPCASFLRNRRMIVSRSTRSAAMTW